MRKLHEPKCFVMEYTKHPFAFAYLIFNDALSPALKLNPQLFSIGWFWLEIGHRF